MAGLFEYQYKLHAEPVIVVEKAESDDSGDRSPISPRGSIMEDDKPKKPEPPKSEFKTKLKPIIDHTGLKQLGQVEIDFKLLDAEETEKYEDLKK